MKTCKHCGHGRVSRPRGLCWSCYYRPEVREQYARLSPRGVEVHEGRRSPAPTQHRPGTVGKIVVLAMRVRNGEELYHQDDARPPVPQLRTNAVALYRARLHRITQLIAQLEGVTAAALTAG